MIQAQVRPGDLEAQLYRLKSIAGKVSDRVGKAVEREAINLVGYIKEQKLSDGVLHVRTGRLRRSITYSLEQVSQSSFRARVGTNVAYARIHEYGFNGTVNVKEHTVKEYQRRQAIAFGKLMKEPKMVTVRAHTVAAHSMKMNMPARPFMKPSLTENAGRITDNLRKAVMEAVR